jgi:outer membrane protein
LLEFTRRKVEAGTLTKLDQQRADSEVETIRTALFAAEQAYAQQANVLKNMLADNYQPWMDVTIVPSENLTPVLDLPANRAVSWVNALNQRPDILQMRLDLEKQDIVLRFTYNQLFPSLELFGSYGWQAVEHGFSSALGDIRDGSNPFYSVGVVFSIPLGNVTARNTHKASQL